MPTTLYMVVEHFKNAVAVYRRFRDSGRLRSRLLGIIHTKTTVVSNLLREFGLARSSRTRSDRGTREEAESLR